MEAFFKLILIIGVFAVSLYSSDDSKNKGIAIIIGIIISCFILMAG